jgi:hypothetical protein
MMVTITPSGNRYKARVPGRREFVFLDSPNRTEAWKKVKDWKSSNPPKPQTPFEVWSRTPNPAFPAL